MQMYAKQDEQASLKALFPLLALVELQPSPARVEGWWEDMGEEGAFPKQVSVHQLTHPSEGPSAVGVFITVPILPGQDP